jgi:hypothetical protein
MKKTFILLILTVLTFSADAFAQKKKSDNLASKEQTASEQMTAEQYFRALPDDYVVGTPKDKEEIIGFKEPKLDYVSFLFEGEQVPKALAGNFKEPEGLGKMRIFRGKDTTIVGLRLLIGDSTEKTPTTDSYKITTYLLEYKDGKWTNKTDALLPKISVDYAYKVLSEDFQMKELKQEDVWIEYQINELHKGIMTVARVKGNELRTNLKFFIWNGAKFVEPER